MLTYDDNRWNDLLGGYKVPYDPRPALKDLERQRNVAARWDELWNELHHQGDIGEASYAALIKLIELECATRALDWNFYAFACAILVERHRKTNPEVPTWLREHFDKSLELLLQTCSERLKTTSDPDLVRLMVAVLAVLKGEVQIALIVGLSDKSEIQEYAEENSAWSSVYQLKE